MYCIKAVRVGPHICSCGALEGGVKATLHEKPILGRNLHLTASVFAVLLCSREDPCYAQGKTLVHKERVGKRFAIRVSLRVSTTA